uniref:DDE-type integrase/transposase/recombinase n=1 Tax=Paenibacillus alginolyticus TaxID=59839 RepID=UPI0035E461EE
MCWVVTVLFNSCTTTKKIIKPMLGFKSFKTAEKTIAGIEVMHMIRKGQVECNHSSALSVVELINKLFGLTA